MPEPFRWDAVSRRFRDPSGKFVSESTVRAVLDRTLASGAQATRGITEGLASGNVSLAQWQAGMREAVKSSQLAASALAKGGWAQMSSSDFLFAARRIKEQYRHLRKFAGQLATGAQPLGAQAAARAELYAEAARATHREMERRLARQGNREYERSVLGAADHCEGCLDAASAGWQPIGSLPAVGSRDCLSRCHCHFEFRMAAEMEAAA